MRFLIGASLALAAVSTTAWMAFAGTGKNYRPMGGTDLPPVCCFGPDCQQTGLIETADCGGNETTYVLDATGSYDPEGKPLTFFWESCPGSTIDDPTSPLTILRLDTSSDCGKFCGVRLRIHDGKHESFCRLFVQVLPPKGGCTYTQGFWKNHGPAGCASGNNANEWPVDSLQLGNRTYSAGELCSIFKSPVKGNGLISLAHQLVAAELNKANGASLPTSVSDALDAAHALIGDLVVPPVGGGVLSPSLTSPLVNMLAAYNEGQVEGTLHCD